MAIGTRSQRVRWSAKLVLGGAALLALTASAEAAYIKSYNANAATPAPDPTSPEGGSWSITGTSFANVEKGPGSEDGQNYWRVNDTNTNINDSGAPQNNSANYLVSGGSVASPGDQTVIDALTSPDGWRASFEVKVPHSSNTTVTPGVDYQVPTFVDIRNGRRIYDIAFVNDGTANEGLYNVQSGSGFLASDRIAALDLDEYHRFDLVYKPNTSDPTQDTLEIYIDGAATPAFIKTDSNSNASTFYRVQWGSGLSSAMQTVHWRNFTFESPAPIPEPAAAGLLGVAGLAALSRRRRA